MITIDIVTATLAAAVQFGTPLLLVTLGEILAERTGIINLGLEGMMLTGALAGFLGCSVTASPWIGLLFALLASGLLALWHGFLCVTLRANQIVSGLALTMIGTGISGFLGKSLVGQPLVHNIKPLLLPGLSALPWLGKIFFHHDPLVYLSYLLVPLIAVWLFYTRPGLEMRAAGESPATADSLGINVAGIRILYTVAGGMLAGLGGAYLSLAYTPMWIENMTAGRGWIAVALVIFATWHPGRAMAGAYLFGLIEAVQFRLQAFGLPVSSFFLNMTPYLVTIAVLIIASRESLRHHFAAPAALGTAYAREERS